MWSSRLCRSWARWTCVRFCMRPTSSADAGLNGPWELLFFVQLLFMTVLRSRPVCRLCLRDPLTRRMKQVSGHMGALLCTRQNLLCRCRLSALLSQVWCCCAIYLLHAELLLCLQRNYIIKL